MDNPKGDYDRLMNYAYAKDNRAYLSYADGKYDIDLCEYVSDLAKAKGYDFSPEFIMEDGLLDNYDDDFAILYYCAVQAAELRERLKLYEDKLEEGKLVELPCKVGDTVYLVNSERICNKKVKDIVFYIDGDIGFNKHAIGKSIFLTREEAEKKVEELSK